MSFKTVKKLFSVPQLCFIKSEEISKKI